MVEKKQRGGVSGEGYGEGAGGEEWGRVMLEKEK